jgi:hypothetical protein
MAHQQSLFEWLCVNLLVRISMKVWDVTHLLQWLCSQT